MRRDATRHEIAAGGLAGAHREGRSEVSAKRARLRLRLPSRRVSRARRAVDRRRASTGRLFRGPVSISPLALVSSRRPRPFFASAIGSRPVLSLASFPFPRRGTASFHLRWTQWSSSSDSTKEFDSEDLRQQGNYFISFSRFFNRWHVKRSFQRVSRGARMFRYCWTMGKFAWLRQAKGHRARIVTERYA